MATKNRLELTWIGKDERPRLEPRILLEDRDKSYGRPGPGLHDNRLIFGDNLLALKALEQEFTGKVKCIFIDPPYNTGSAFTHYDDGVEHSMWLTLMRDRLEQLKVLLRDDGSLWIAIDDNECHYLKVVCDEVFGRANFVASVIWQKVLSVKNSAIHMSVDHDYILVYAKNAGVWRPSHLPASDKQRAAYKNPDGDPRGDWQSVSLSARNFYSKGTYPVRCPGGGVIPGPPAGRYWSISEEKLWELHRSGAVWWGADGNGVPRRKMYLADQGDLTVVPRTIWMYDDIGHTQEAKKEALAFNAEAPFPTPKPERLAARVISVATDPGDLVLDSFAGSGTTGAVAHKMGRRWIMVELGEHCHTHIIPRLQKVIDGADSGGVTEATGWQGGGGFRYFRLAPSLLEKDPWGEWVVSKQYNPAMLAEAVCKHEGFRYEPSQEVYWQHGRSTERDYIFVTTQTLTREQLTVLADHVGSQRSLLVCCGAFRAGKDEFANLTLKKIPQAVLHRCEWGKDDYSLNITERSAESDDDAPVTSAAPAKAKPGRPKATDTSTLSLFDRPEPPAPTAGRGRAGKKKP